MGVGAERLRPQRYGRLPGYPTDIHSRLTMEYDELAPFRETSLRNLKIKKN